MITVELQHVLSDLRVNILLAVIVGVIASDMLAVGGPDQVPIVAETYRIGVRLQDIVYALVPEVTPKAWIISV
jgi:hypothetical protein